MSDTALVTFLPVSEQQAKLVLRAMKAVAAANGELTAADRDALEGAARHIFYSGSRLDFAAMSQPTSAALEEAFPTADYRRYILQLIAVMAFVDGKVDERKLDIVLQYAAGLGVTDDYVRDLAETAKGHSDWVRADMSRNNVESIRGMDLGKDFAAQFLPYDTNPIRLSRSGFAVSRRFPTKASGGRFMTITTKRATSFPANPMAFRFSLAFPMTARMW